jgi:hypothetical protein
MDLSQTMRSKSSFLEIIGIAVGLAAVLGLSIPVLDNAIVIPPVHGDGRWVELGIGVAFFVTGLILQDERVNALALVISRAVLLVVTFLAVNCVIWFAHPVDGDSSTGRTPPWTAGVWKGAWESSELVSGTAELQLRTDPAVRRHAVTGTLSVTYLNGRCVFALAGDPTGPSRAELKITSIRPGSDRCDAGKGDRIVVQRAGPGPDLLTVTEIAEADPTSPIFIGSLTRAPCPTPKTTPC